MKKFLLISDCSTSHICGVTRKQNEIIKNINKFGYDCKLINTDIFWSFKCPYWNNFEITTINPVSYYIISDIIEKYDPENICIMTEGSIGLMASIHCNITGRKYSTMRCTRVECYFNNYLICKIIELYFFIFHYFSECCITPSIEYSKTINHPNCVGILNGCDTNSFSSKGEKYEELNKYKKPLWLYVGRITNEKNILILNDLSDKLDGTIITVGDGPEKKNLNKPNIINLGWIVGEKISQIYRSCDLFIFPSKTDTFGQVMVEAMASGLPVAAYNTIGPNDVILHNKTGYLSDNLEESCNNLLQMIKNKDNIKDECINHSKSFSWDNMIKSLIKFQPNSHRKYYYQYFLIGTLSSLFYFKIKVY
jgi:glycosyltransferase involved in cell wall biosynthesis